MATIPTIPGFTVGQILGAASLQSMADMETFLATHAGGYFQAHQGVAQSIANATDVPITFPAEDIDTDGGHSTSTNTSRYTAQTTGRYIIGGAYHSVNGTTDFGAFFRVNGAGTPAAYTRLPHTATGDQYLSVGAVEQPLSAGDYVELCVRQTSGGALLTSVANGGCLFLVVFARTP